MKDTQWHKREKGDSTQENLFRGNEQASSALLTPATYKYCAATVFTDKVRD